MSSKEYETIVEGAGENYREETEHKIREELLRRRREELENLGVLRASWVETKIRLYTRRTAKHLSEQNWHLTA